MTAHEVWMKELSSYQDQMKAMGVQITLPPPSMLELGLHYLEVKPGTSMKAELPFQPRFTNPIGTFQGGFLAAGLDDIFGPLSYITAGRPCMTLSLNLTYLRAFTAKMPKCILEGFVLQKTKSFIFMRGEARTVDGEILAIAESHVSISPDPASRKDP